MSYEIMGTLYSNRKHAARALASGWLYGDRAGPTIEPDDTAESLLLDLCQQWDLCGVDEAAVLDAFEELLAELRQQ